VSKTGEPAETFTAACVQFDVQRGEVAANLEQARRGIEDAAADSTRLCVLPEMWSTSFMLDYPAATLEAAAAAESELSTLSQRFGMVIVGSSVERAGGRIFNTARVHDHGELLGTYRKIHLFSPNAENRNHDAGETPLLVDSSIGRLGVIICYDLRFPELVRWHFHKGTEVLVVPAQWPEARAQHWRTLLRARAIENEMFVIGCNRTGQETSLKNDEPLAFPGDGRIVDPMGEVLSQGTGADEPLTAEIELRRVRTMRRILPVARDQRPLVYKQLWDDAWPDMVSASRDGDGGDGA
jgi:predicted amidohydrolase